MLFLFALFASTIGTPAPKECPPVTTLCCSEVFKPSGLTYSSHAEFLYLQPNGTQLYYGASAIGIETDESDPIASIASPDWTILMIDPDYHPGFDIGVSFLLNEANIDIGVNWEWMHADDSNSFEATSAAGHMVGPFFDIGPNSAAYKIAKGVATSHFDAVNVTFGRNICFFNNFHTHFYAAAAFTRIRQTLDTNYSNAAKTISRDINTSSTFTGAGPQVGLDYDYRIQRSFFFSGTTAFSLFMGQMKNTTTYQSYTAELIGIGLTSPNNQAAAIPNRTQLVPGFEQKLGLAYSATWDRVRATFEIGYQCEIYLQAVQNFNMASQALPTDLAAVSPDVAVYAVAFEQSDGNFILTGPYLFAGFDF